MAAKHRCSREEDDSNKVRWASLEVMDAIHLCAVYVDTCFVMLSFYHLSLNQSIVNFMLSYSSSSADLG